MQRYALAPLGPTRERVLVAIPRSAADWTIAAHNRGLHRLLVPVDASLRAVDALCYIADHLRDHVAGVHLLNVQPPIVNDNVTALVNSSMLAGLRHAAGERVLALLGEAFQESAIPLSGEVAFGDAAEMICLVAQHRGCSGIVMARDGFELHDLIRGSVAASVLRFASIPVTIVSACTGARDARELNGMRSSEATAALHLPQVFPVCAGADSVSDDLVVAA
jgi:nucleotide-binding universal stress UspA family protein